MGARTEAIRRGAPKGTKRRAYFLTAEGQQWLEENSRKGRGWNELKILLIGIIGSLVMFGLELWGGIKSGSWALVSDSLHLVSDAVAMGIALWATWFAKLPPSRRYTF